MLKRICLLALGILLFMGIFLTPALGADLEDELAGIVTYYEEENKYDLGHWEEVVGLSKSGVDFSDGIWQLPDWDVDSLDESSSANQYATTILGILASGEDPHNIDGEGRNLVDELALRQIEDGSFGDQFTETIWSIIALDKAGAAYDTGNAVDYVISQKTSDGGFALSGSKADPDITGAVLMALAPHTGIAGVSDAINEAKLAMQNMQLDNGGFASWGTENPETIASVIRGLLACGEDITGEKWNKNGNTMIDALFAFQLSDKSFSHTLGSGSNPMATRQALIAVADMVKSGIDYQVGSGGQSGDDEAGEVTVKIRVEGAAEELLNAEVNVTGTALDALKEAVGEDNVQFDTYGMVGTILGESGQANVTEGIDTSWMYYVIREGSIEPGAFGEGPGSYDIQNGDEVVFYIGAYDENWNGKTYFPVVRISPAAPTAGQSLTLYISAQSYDYSTGLQELSMDAVGVIGDYTVKVGSDEYSSFYGQVTIPDIPEGTLTYRVSNYNEAGYPDVVAFTESIEIEPMAEYQVRVRVEGTAGNLADESVTLAGTALDALKEAVGEDNVQFDVYGMIGTILGESGQSDVAEGIDTSWMYYVIRDGSIDTDAFSQGSDNYNIQDGDEVVFYIGAYDKSWVAKTYFPIVSLTPAAPKAGDDLELTISACKNTWGMLEDLTEEEITAIGDYIVTVGENQYLSSNGKITIPKLTAGTLQYTISNMNEAGYPDVVAYSGRIQVGNAAPVGPGTDSSITVKIAVVGKDGTILYGPSSVYLSTTAPYGHTAMSALDATGLDYELSNRNDGMVVAIAGQANEGMNGWCGKVNSSSFWDVPKEISVKKGDQIIFWYSMDANFDGPNWEDLLSGNIIQPTMNQLSDASKEKMKDILKSYQEELEELAKTFDFEKPGSGLKLLNVDEKMSGDAAKDLKEELDDNKVEVSGSVGTAEAVLGDKEVFMLVPADALSRTINLRIKEITPDQEFKGSEIKLGSSLYEFGPAKTKFNKPITISIKVALTEDIDINQLSPAWFDEETKQWIPLPGLIDLKTGLMVFQIDHFTTFAVIQKQAAAKTIEVIEPERVTFADVDEDIAWAKDAIEILAGQGIIHGTGNGLFEPGRPICRSEFVSLMVTVLDLKAEEYQNGLFYDVESSDWFAAAVATAYHNQIIAGYPDQCFKPGNSISRNEIAVIMYQSKGKNDDLHNVQPEYRDLEMIPGWALNGVKYVYAQGLMSGYENGDFQGTNPLTRAEAAVVFYKYINTPDQQLS